MLTWFKALRPETVPKLTPDERVRETRTHRDKNTW